MHRLCLRDDEAVGWERWPWWAVAGLAAACAGDLAVTVGLILNLCGG